MKDQGCEGVGREMRFVGGDSETHPKVMQPRITRGFPVVGVIKGIFAVEVWVNGRVSTWERCFRRVLAILASINGLIQEDRL